MMSVLAWSLGTLAAIALLPVLLLLVQVLMACLPARAQPLGNNARPQVAVLVPAHDEASLIGATLASIARSCGLATACWWWRTTAPTTPRNWRARPVPKWWSAAMRGCAARATPWTLACATWPASRPKW